MRLSPFDLLFTVFLILALFFVAGAGQLFGLERMDKVEWEVTVSFVFSTLEECQAWSKAFAWELGDPIGPECTAFGESTSLPPDY